ncbi:D-inositol 3-phosphate glycosyltransferase [Anaerohalosphaera lusitana]|uniref:D-inositol 3-phosphate glycosyltransferase n=1 Tax=Anaerohalosphaera lusitana TaxID=1936003 RepID=A0A1U9NP05_9BACT|nr:glycosyltransferase family 4 protein [Anaerohalosphaera lusitana]AQT69629.1 D-inositol 3-phosphate glycosyltransferase [Anaerohalosphaera lusitana]
MIKLLMINYEFPPIGGGGANANLQLLKQFAGNPELQIDLLTSAPEPGVFTEEFAPNVKVTRVGVHKKSLQCWRKIEVIEWLMKADKVCRQMVRSNDYDLAHAFFAFPSGWLCYRNRGKLPYLVSLRGSDVPGLNPRFKLDYKLLAPLFRRIWKNSKLLVACSNGLKERAKNFMPEADYTVICNGVDTDLFKPGRNCSDGTFNLITVGRLSATKRLDLLVEAVGILRDKKHDVRLSVVGTGQLENELREDVAEKGLEHAIELSGHLKPKEVCRLYRKSDAYISGTMSEGMSNSMLEAMACGLPLISTDCEGLEELLDGNGIAVADANPGALADAVERLIAQPEMLKSMSEISRERALRFSWQDSAAQYMSLYNEILAKS